MAEEKKQAFLSRWSRLKQESEKPVEKQPEAPVPALPPVDKLTPESDFTAFMQPKVGDALRRVALKKLFSDPHFNTSDPFEPFSGDWNVSDPISEEMLASLEQMKQMLKKPPADTPQTEPAKEVAQDPTPNPDEPGRQDA